mmetsp:Transcript_8823/g.12881  ORF Transcript_8823/g.12881 Transcript_8823/m.12881 type:complete len:98 (+) Transcript_8823:183-476(+)
MASDAMNTWNKQGVETLSTEQEEVKREGIQKRTHPHGARRKEILGRYPDISKFMGHHPMSFFLHRRGRLVAALCGDVCEKCKRLGSLPDGIHSWSRL